jgi:hypothetical protein
MITEQLNKSEWQPYFDRVSKALAGEQAEIEVSSLELGNQIEARWVPLLGITYDPKSDVVEVLVEGLDHLIQHPQTVYIEHNGGLHSMEVIDDSDTRQIVRLRGPLMLSSPGTS